MSAQIDDLRRRIVGVVIDNVYGGAIEDDDVVYETVDAVLGAIAAAPQPKPSRILAGWEMSPTDMKSLGQELIDAAEVMSGGEPDCNLVLSVVPEGGFVDDDGVSNTHPILLVLCADAEQEGGYPVDPWNPSGPQPECVDVSTLVAYAEGRIQHAKNGLCPDELQGHQSRDPDCAVCRALLGTYSQPECVGQTEAFEKWADAALYIADVNGMSDDTVIPTWPTGDEDMEQWPQLTVGAVREVVAVLSHAEQEPSHDDQ